MPGSVRSVAEARRRFRALLDADGVTVVLGGAGPLDALVCERAGFDAFFLAGSQVAATLYGAPDVGVLGLHDMATQASRVAGRVGIPVLVDGDTGYGNAVNVHLAMVDLVRSGAAAVQFEDQEAPKKSGTSGGRRCIPVAEAVGKYRAAVRARDELDPAFAVCARTDAIGAEGGGFEDAVRRCVAYAEDGGVDLVWLNSLQSREQVAEACARIPVPVLTVWGGPGVGPSDQEYAELGLRIALYPVLASKVALQATWQAVHDVRGRGTDAMADQRRAAAENPWGAVPLTSLTGFDAVRGLEAEFLPEDAQRDYDATFGHTPSS